MRRAGFTLVEMVGLTVALGMLLALSANVLHQAFSAHHVSLDHLQQMRSVELFVERWRADVQAAKQVKPEGESLVVQLEDAEFVYATKDQWVTRTRRQDGQDVGRDQWRLPGRCTLAWVIDDAGQMPLVVGRLQFTVESGGSETAQGESTASEQDVSKPEVNMPAAIEADGLRGANKNKVGFGFDEVEIVARVGVGEAP